LQVEFTKFYPVTVDPDFGYTTIGGSWVAIAQQNKLDTSTRRGTAWTMPGGGPYVANYIKAYVQSAGTDIVGCKVFINQKDSGGAGTHAQIAIGGPNACAAAAHWEQFNLAGETLTSGVDYILNIIGDWGDVSVGDDYQLAFDADGVTAYDPSDTYCSEENPWTIGAGSSNKYSIYCNYTEEEVAKKHTFRLDPKPRTRMSFHPNLKLG